MAGPRDYQAELRRVMNALAEAAAEATDEETLAEARAKGLDPEAEAQRVRETLQRAVRSQKRAQRLETRRQYEAEVARLRRETYDLPESASERRLLLAAALATQPQMQGMLTVQFRDLDQLSDADVERSLKRLAELGVLDELPGGRPPE